MYSLESSPFLVIHSCNVNNSISSNVKNYIKQFAFVLNGKKKRYSEELRTYTCSFIRIIVLTKTCSTRRYVLSIAQASQVAKAAGILSY